MPENKTPPDPKVSKVPDQVIELMKWLIGTVGLGLTGILINQKIQSTELEIKRLEADAKFLEVVTKDIGPEIVNTEIKYLEYILTFVTTSQIRKEIQGTIKRKKALLIEDQSQIIKAKEKQKIIESKARLDKNQTKKFEAKRSEEVLASSTQPQKSIDKLVSEENDVAPDAASLNLGGNKIDSLQKITTPVIIVDDEEEFNLVGVPTTRWCKQGYFVEFSERLRVGISNLSENSISINLKDIETSKENPSLIKDNITIIEGEVSVQEFGNYKYQITLNYIGTAGKNPFTKAAYVTVSVYKKVTSE